MSELKTSLGKALQHLEYAKQWKVLSKEISVLYRQAMKVNSSNRSELTAIWTFAIEKADNHEFEQALKAAQKLKPTLELVASGALKNDQEIIPENAVKIASLRIALWGNVRSSLKDQLNAIIEEIDNICSDDEELEIYVGLAKSELPKRLQFLDNELENTFDKMIQAKTKKDRDKLKKEANTLIGAYLKTLESGESGNFFADLDDGGGFGKKQPVASEAVQLLKSLQSILKPID